MISGFNNSGEAILDAVLQEPIPSRSAVLRRLCGEDNELRLQLEARLAAREALDGLLSPNRSSSDAPEPHGNEDPLIGAQIGAYKIRERLGEGGCGVVYAAEQGQPIRRKVALKIMKPGVDSKEVLARFAQEQQALAMMEHSSIARAFEAGMASNGRPYFVMELVRGKSITEFCDHENLDVPGRLRLFINVARAIHHAHGKGIIHRDLKPSNVLVTVRDNEPMAKVIDFGIAKATEGRLTDLTIYTGVHQFLGTPVYMSPEQAQLSALEIDARSDIYSLGVLLYELLSGAPPFSPAQLLNRGVDEMRRVIREEDPKPPSTRITNLPLAEQTSLARRRGLEPNKLFKLLRGDLDWIVIKCLEKNRARRYATAAALADDVQRYLQREPISAHPPTVVYRSLKWFSKNKTTVAAVGLLSAGLLAGVTLGVWKGQEMRRWWPVVPQNTGLNAKGFSTNDVPGFNEVRVDFRNDLLELKLADRPPLHGTLGAVVEQDGWNTRAVHFADSSSIGGWTIETCALATVTKLDPSIRSLKALDETYLQFTLRGFNQTMTVNYKIK